jgi:hypothetical protein
MATEYYIVKPNKKQTFYLGKRISHLEGISEWTHTKEARFPEWEFWEDVVFDLQENSRYFLEGDDILVGQMWDLCSAIYNFCDDKVYMDNDCSDNAKTWRDWECIDVFEDIFDTPLTELEKWTELFQLVPREYWIIKDHILYEYETVKSYLESQYNKLKETKIKS